MTMTMTMTSISAPPLDHNYYPHLVDAILSYASREALLSFRATSKAFHAKADRELFRHVAIDHWDRQYRPSLVTPCGARLPMRWQDEEAIPAERSRWLARLREHTAVVDYCRSFNAYVYDPELADFMTLAPAGDPLSASPSPSPLSMVRRVHADSVMETFMPVLRARTAVDFVALTKLQVDGVPVPGNTSLFPTLAEKWVVNLVFDPAVASEGIALNVAHAGAMEQTREFVFTFTPLPSGSGSGADSTPCALLDGPVGRAIIAIRPYLPTARVTFVGAHTLNRHLLGLDASATDAHATAAIMDAIVEMDGYTLGEADEEALREAISALSAAEYNASVPDAELELGVHAALRQRAAIINAPDEVRARSRKSIKKQQRRRAGVARTPIDRVVAYPEAAPQSHGVQVLSLAAGYADRATLLSLRGISKSLLAIADTHLFAHLVVQVAQVDPYLGPSLRVCAPHGPLPGMCWEDPDATPGERAWWVRQLALAKVVDYPDRIHEVYDRALWAALGGAATARRIDCLSAVGGKHVVDYVDWTTGAVPSGTVGAVSPACEELTVNIRYDPRHPLLNQARMHAHLDAAPGRKVAFVFEASTAGPEPQAVPHVPALAPFSMLKDITAHIAEGVLDATIVGLADIPREALDLPPCTTPDALRGAFREAVLDKWHERARLLPSSHADYGQQFPVEMTQSMRFLSRDEWTAAATEWPAGTGRGRSCGDPPIFGSLAPILL
jgi:hypothetical protein